MSVDRIRASVGSDRWDVLSRYQQLSRLFGMLHESKAANNTEATVELCEAIEALLDPEANPRQITVRELWQEHWAFIEYVAERARAEGALKLAADLENDLGFFRHMHDAGYLQFQGMIDLAREREQLQLKIKQLSTVPKIDPAVMRQHTDQLAATEQQLAEAVQQLVHTETI